ncbi:MAG: cell wall-binding repeat-containing protein [Lachnospiraceae bacterium]|nr:cell wall-binding repeat-containing protein [Lachnospiraceae bacterium]
MKKRILAVVLTIVMMIGLMPLSAFADESVTDSEVMAEDMLTPTDDIASEEDLFDLSDDTTSLTDDVNTASAEETLFQTEEALNTLTGEGTEASPYQIGSEADLKAFRDLVNAVTAADDGNRTICAILTDDITLTEAWTPISNTTTVANQYGGIFDGNDHTISGLSINTDQMNQGLFGGTNGAEIKNLKVSGSVISSKNYVGGIVGKIQAGSTIRNCSFSGTVTSSSGTAYAGGLVGCINSITPASLISGCSNDAAVTGSHAGGILGYSTKSATIENCYNTGTINGSSRSGGIVGQLSTGVISNCFNTGAIKEDATNRGGIAGFTNVITENCYFTNMQTMAMGGTGLDGTQVTAISAEQLGDAFVEGDDHPVLAWQSTAAPVSKAVISFNINVEGAVIELDGKTVANPAKAAAGDHTYRVSKSRYYDEAGAFTITEAQATAGDTVTIDVAMVAKTVVSVSVTGNAASYDQGSDLTGLTVTAYYDDNSTEVVTDYEVSGFDSSQPAENMTVTISFGGKSTSFTVNITEKHSVLDPLKNYCTVTQGATYTFVEDEENGYLISNNKGVNSSSATLKLTALSNLELAFDYAVSSEASYDGLKVLLNNTAIGSHKDSNHSGNVSWKTQTVTMARDDVLELTYFKDANGNGGDDVAKLKNFVVSPVYTVTFNTTPADAVVTFNNQSAGKSYLAKAGTYDYTVSAFGYETETGTVTVTDGSLTKDVTLTALPTYELSFNITLPDSVSGDAAISVKNGTTEMTPADGIYHLPAGTYSYTITHPNCDVVTGEVTITDANVTKPITLTRKWVIGDYFTGMALTAENGASYGFVLDTTDETVLVNNNGGKGNSKATLTLTMQAAGQLAFHYTVNSEATYDKFYVTKNGTKVVADKSGVVAETACNLLVASGDKIVLTYEKDVSGDKNGDCVKLCHFELNPVYALSFTGVSDVFTLTVKDNDGNVVNAEADGSYTLVPGTYTYEAAAFGYQSQTGSVTISDKNEAVALSAAELLPTKTLTFVLPEGASAVVSHSSAGTLTPAEGTRYVLPAGETYQYVITKEGYLPIEASITLDDDQTVTVSAEDMTYIGVAWDGTTKTEPLQADGVYQIGTAAELAWFADRVNNGETAAQAMITNEINLNNKPWKLIGAYISDSTYDNPFTGSIDGQGHIISGATSAIIDYLGYTGATEASVKNLTVMGTISGSGHVGGIVNTCYGTVEACAFKGSVTNASASSASTGGIVGRCIKGATIRNCVNYGTISNTATIYYDATVCMGGIVGQGYANIVNCYNLGSVSKTGTYGKSIGGIAGTSNSLFVNNYNAGPVSGGSLAQALIGATSTETQVTNCYYLSTAGSDVIGTAKTADEMKAEDFVIVLSGTEAGAYHADTDGLNGGYPVLAWQGGTEVIDPNAEKVALDKAALTIDTADILENKTLSLPVSGENGAAISWSSDNEAVIANNGAVTLPAEGTVTVKLTATLTLGLASDTKEFEIKVISEKQQKQNAVDDLAKKLNGKSLWAQEILHSGETTVGDVALRAMGENILAPSGTTVTLKSVGEKVYPADDTNVNIDADGTIHYFTGGKGYERYAQYNDVVLTVTKDGASADATVRFFISWDRETVQQKVNAAAAAITWENVRQTNTTTGTTTQKDNVYKDTIEGYTNNNLRLPNSLGACTATWRTEFDSRYGTILNLTEKVDDAGVFTECAVTRPAFSDQLVSVIGTISFNLLNDGEDEANITATRTFAFTTEKDENATVVDPELSQENLEKAYEGLITQALSPDDEKADLSAVTDDLIMPRPADLAKVGIMQDRSNQRVVLTSGDTKVLSFYGYRANIYRPLPGEPDAEVSYTVEIQNRSDDSKVAGKTFTMTVKALTQAEIDEAAALMNCVATQEVYWNGLKPDNAAQNAVTGNLAPFAEVTVDNEGTMGYVRSVAKITGLGIILDDIPGYDPMSSQNWRILRSDNERLIEPEVLRVNRPLYDTTVKVDSVMTYSRFGKYWEKFGASEEATDATKAAYAAFEQFYKKPVALDLVVKGTEGEEDPVKGAKKVTITVSGQDGGAFLYAPQSVEVSSDAAENAGLTDGFAAEGSEAEVTALDALTTVHSLLYPDFADDISEYLVADSSGFVSKLFGISTTANGFLVNSLFPADGDLGLTVTTTALKADDVVEFFTYADEEYGDYYVRIVPDSTEVTGGSSLSVTVSGAPVLNAFNYTTTEAFYESFTPMAGLGLGWLDRTTGAIEPIDGIKTDATGKATIVMPTTPGRYELSVFRPTINEPEVVLTVTAIDVSGHEDENKDGVCDDCGTVISGLVDLRGSDRYQTCALIAKAAFEGTVPDEVVVVTGQRFPDALAANAYAGAHNGAVVLCKDTKLPDPIKSLLKDTWGGQVKKAVIIGGTITTAVDNDLKACGVTTCDRSMATGSDRYATAELIARKMLDEHVAADTVILATGKKAADALSVSPVSYSRRMPILLVKGNGTMTDKTKQLLKKFDRVIILGGCTQKSVVASAGVAADKIVEIKGKDRYETSSLIASYFAYDAGYDTWSCAVARGRDANFPDALAGGMLAGRKGQPVLLVSTTARDAENYISQQLSGSKTAGDMFVLGAAGDEPSIVKSIKKATGLASTLTYTQWADKEAAE